MARPRAADDFETIRARMEELRLERDRSLAGQKLGPRISGAGSGDDNRKDERGLLRSASEAGALRVVAVEKAEFAAIEECPPKAPEHLGCLQD